MSLPQLQNLMKRDPEVGPSSSMVHVRGFPSQLFRSSLFWRRTQ